MPDPTSSFPGDFVWGAATAAYQIEGAVGADGRGESIWDRFCATPGKVRNGETGEVACDFYNRSAADIALMRELGLDAFRFSISWPRILPEGRGRVNQTGLDFYDRLVDDLLAVGIAPYATLYHWDLPQVLEDEGGWPNRATAEAFVEYAQVVAARLGDRVGHWITHNEPWVVSWLGYSWGVHAPGRTSDADAIATSHHLLLSHGWAVDVLRREAPNAQVGITLNLAHVDRAGDAPEDVAAAREVDGNLNRWFLDPLFRGAYPEDMLERYAPAAPAVRDGDLEAISAPIDFLGVNNYSRHLVRASANGEGPHMVRDPESQYTDMGWEVYPDGLYQLLARVRDDYGPPAIFITENGAAFGDIRGHDGRVRDPERQAYIASHVEAVGRALAEGVPMRGYFVWSLLDNFEWAFGYSKRFGIVYVDYPTLERVPKDSFHWYRDFIAGQRSETPAGAAAG
ncbi:MAG TPA: GH1 family beta-glucosidase [Gaiellaceae bacterium]|jgi:beta-glucosidase